MLRDVTFGEAGMAMRAQILSVLLVLMTTGPFVASGCADKGKRPLGESCESSTECDSGLCYQGECVDPAADPDFDGLSNQVESDLGSNRNLSDSDGDGISDPDELDDNFALVDTDHDGRPDITESAVADADADCVTDQYDVDDATPTTDVTPMTQAVCPTLGICGVAVDQMRAACPDGAHAVCVFSDVPGYADPEVRCDGKDENCDGVVDEGFPRGCGASPGSIAVSTSAANTLATGRYRATLVVGPPALGTTTTSRYRALLGNNAGVAPRPESP